ncbi:MAG: hypothetical protein AMS18_00350 [Gemmatimonas sp. SG8_17]|nr:MAG: hypothetical protein AMS18_00350 [Gemmatimonas sp. SG8_17]
MHRVVITMSVDAWDVLEQSLQLDASSAAVDPALRQQIRAALEEMHVEYTEHDPDTCGCKYVGLGMWDCGHTDQH